MLKVTGAWTKAGIASCVRVQGATKRDDFLFDCGFLNSETILSNFVFISHGHIDHVGSCISHARARGLSGSVAEYYVPHDIVQHLNDAKKAFEKLDNSSIPMNIIGVGPGESFTFGTNMKVKVFSTCHRVPSQGYAVYVKKKGELLPELRGMSGNEIRELRQMGQAIHSPDSEELQMVYTGDTTLSGLTQYDSSAFIFRAHTLIIEVTYLDGEMGKAEKYGHIHIEDIVQNAHLFAEVEHLVFVHLSQKYSLRRAVKLLRDQLPSSLLHKVSVSLHSFGASECLTRLTDSKWDHLQNTQAGWGWTNRSNNSYNSNNNNNYSNNNNSSYNRGSNGGGSSGTGGGGSGNGGIYSRKGFDSSNGGNSSGGNSGNSNSNANAPIVDLTASVSTTVAAGSSSGSGSVYIGNSVSSSLGECSIQEITVTNINTFPTTDATNTRPYKPYTVPNHTNRYHNTPHTTHTTHTNHGAHGIHNNQRVAHSSDTYKPILKKPYKQPGQVYRTKLYKFQNKDKSGGEK